ncbi:MAG: Serine/threonine-protein kinase pkn1 [Labilithrix sp.]|nr:Serine/threonine-protein kinase pkn1 [Labilithrix sp.]
MRLRSVLAALATSCLLAAAVVRCSVPPPTPPPQILATRERVARGAFLSLPPGTAALDRAALVASLREMNFNTIIIESTANQAGELVADRVALAVDLQRELDADVFVGSYQASAPGDRSRTSIDALLQKDPAFDKCYAPDGLRLDPDALVVDKIRLCAQDIGKKVADELTRVNASPRIGCYVTHAPELVETLTDAGQSKLQELLRDSASACVQTKRNVLLSPLLSQSAGDPDRAAVLFRETLQDSGINFVLLQDGVGSVDPAEPRRAALYYSALRLALVDRPPPVQVWANIEAFDCEDGGGCTRPHPTTFARLTEQLCGARARVDRIVAYEYIHDLAERPLYATPASVDASPDDTAAAAQLHRSYLEWVDAGAVCPPAR